MLDIHVIDDPAAATVALEPMRRRLLSELATPASAATLAKRVGLARQKINYHLHALEAHGLVRLAQERKWGGLTERLLVATAASYVVSPSALGPVAVDPNREVDRLSASYLIALGARVIREVGDLVRRAKEAGKRLATLAVDTEVRFRSATDRAAFSNELTEAIRNSFRSITMNPPPAAARIAWWSWRTLCRRNPIPRSHHEREERSLRTPFRPGRSRSPRHAGGSLAGHRHWAGYFVLVRADGVRGARREARRCENELRPGHGVPCRRDGLGPAADVCREGRGLGWLAAH